MARPTKLLTEEVVLKAKNGLEKMGQTGGVAIKLRIVIAASEHGITEVCRIMKVTKKSVIEWIKALRDGGVQALTVKPGRGRKPLLSLEQEQVVKEWVENDSQITIPLLQHRLKQEFGITMARGTTHNLLKRLKYSYITPRPIHHKKSSENEEETKKKSSKKDSREA